MKCPFCDSDQNRVIETREQKSGELKRRRRCIDCGERFSTLEVVLVSTPQILKKDGRREFFSKEKLRRGVELACRKRPVSVAAIDNLVDKIDRWIQMQGKKEIKALVLGQKVVEELRLLDDVAFVRFASVYKTFADVQEFVQSLETSTSGPC